MSRRRRPAWTAARRSRAPERVVVALPALDPLETLAVIDVLDQLVAALAAVHGDHLADIAARAGIETPRPRGARWVGRHARPGDGDPDF